MTLDDLAERDLAKTDPALFLERHPPPDIIDEVQYAPDLLPVIKIAVDKRQRAQGAMGAFWLTGSKKFHLMEGTTESLAGRVAILDLMGLSLEERSEPGSQDAQGAPFLPTPDWITDARGRASIRTGAIGPLGLRTIFEMIWRGSFPRPALPIDVFKRSYIQTYIERDVRALARVGDVLAFQHFVRAAAARTAQLVNYADLARDADIDQKTAKSWLGILEASGLVHILQPYHTNVTKRLVKTPKLYFLDTGLAAHLTQWTSPEALEAGALFESFVFAEILKSYWHRGRQGGVLFLP